MLVKKLHHAAFRCRDAAETVAFYTDVLGMRFSHAVGGDHVPSTGAYDPHMHVFLEMEDGSSLAFFEVPLAAGGVKDTEMPDWVQHFAMEVADEATLLATRDDLVARGLAVVGPTDHGFCRSIYFHDPSGHRLELTCRTAAAEELARYAAGAPRLLELWDRTHDWSGATAEYNVHG